MPHFIWWNSCIIGIQYLTNQKVHLLMKKYVLYADLRPFKKYQFFTTQFPVILFLFEKIMEFRLLCWLVSDERKEFSVKDVYAKNVAHIFHTNRSLNKLHICIWHLLLDDICTYHIGHYVNGYFLVKLFLFIDKVKIFFSFLKATFFKHQ